MGKNVVFDEQSAARIAAAVKYVESLQGGDEEPPIEEVDSTPGRTVIRGRFTGEWAKNTEKDVSFTADNGDNGTKTDVYNYFTTVGKAAAATDCVIGLVGSQWVLLSAKPASECVEVSKVDESGNITLLSAINPTGSVVTELTGSVVAGISGSVVTGVACVNGNITVTTTPINNLATIVPLGNLALSSSLDDLIGYTQGTVRLSDLATVTTQNLTLPKQEGCS